MHRALNASSRLQWLFASSHISRSHLKSAGIVLVTNKMNRELLVRYEEKMTVLIFCSATNDG